MPISDENLAKKKNITVDQVALLRQTRGTTNDTLEILPDRGVRRSLRRLEYPDMPRARQAFRAVQARGDDGTTPPNALGDALDQLTRLRSKTVPKSKGKPKGRVLPAALLGATAGIGPKDWKWLGPGNIGGRTRAIVVHPTDAQKIWAASAGGGNWHTTDGGQTWAPVDDFMANLAITCLAMDPLDADTIYAGTGEGFSNGDAIRGAGIFRTVDGTTWAQLGATTTADFQAVNRVALSANAKALLAATTTGLFRSTDADRATWKRVLDLPIADVKFAPGSSTHAVAGGLNSGEAWFTTDGGRTWQRSTHPTWSGRVELAYSTKKPQVVYASVQMTHGTIFRSTDGGVNWHPRATQGPDGAAPYLGDQGWYDNVIWAGDPTNENLVIVGGVDLWRSLDGGDTLSEISTWWEPASVHADHHAIVSHPNYDGVTNRTVFFGNDGGVFRADDLQAVGNGAPPHVTGWTELVNGYGVTQFFGAAGNLASGKIIGGAQDNGTVCFDPAKGTEAWTTIFGGDGGWCASDPSDPNVFYGEYVYLNIHRNTDGGASDDTAGDRYISGQFWNGASGQWDWKPAPFRIPDAFDNAALFIAPFMLDPNEPNRILAGGLSLWRTNDAKTPNTPTKGPKWASIKPSTGNEISALAIARGDSNMVWVGHVNGDVFSTVNGTASQPAWKRPGATGPARLEPQRYCACITIDPTDPAVVYVSFGGYEKSNIWVTRDAGENWANLGKNLPAAPIRAIAVHPRKPKLLYIGTEVGVFGSEDAGGSWSPTNEGPTNCSVDDLFWMGEVLVAATHGRGVFTIDLSGQ